VLGHARRLVRRPGPARGPASVGPRRAARARHRPLRGRPALSRGGRAHPARLRRGPTRRGGHDPGGLRGRAPGGPAASLYHAVDLIQRVKKQRPAHPERAGKEHMPEVTQVSVEIAGTEISFETGRLAKQASGAVVVSAGDTVVLCTATAGNVRDVDFLPLTVDVEERMYAAGKIPGSFFKREGRAGEKATLTARLIDRPIRPLFPKGWNRETQLVAMPLSIDHINPYDVLAMNGASAALMISEIPVP